MLRAAGATYHGRPAGSLADLAAFSFHGRKGITAGEGGALVGDRGDLMDRARKLHTYGIAPAVTREGEATLPVPSFDEAGYNYRLSDVQAAIMRVQLGRLPDLLAARTRSAQVYAAGLGDLDHPPSLSHWTTAPTRGSRTSSPSTRASIVAGSRWRCASRGGQLRHLCLARPAREWHPGRSRVPGLGRPVPSPSGDSHARQPH